MVSTRKLPRPRGSRSQTRPAVLTLVPFVARLDLEICRIPSPAFITVANELAGCQAPQRAMWSSLILIDASHLDLGARIVERYELRILQAFVSTAQVRFRLFDREVLH